MSRKVATNEDRSNCNTMQKFPTLNVHSKNSFVKIGDEFKFSSDVLIVVPEKRGGLNKAKADASVPNKQKEECPQNNNSGKNNFSGKFNQAKDWLLSQNVTTNHKIVLALLVLMTVGLLVLVLLNAGSHGEEIQDIPVYVNRTLWDSQQRNCTYNPLGRSAALVIIEQTSGTFCCNFSECQQSVKNSQQYHLSKPYLCDITFGFLVGGDCRIYEGRNFSNRENLKVDPYHDWSVEIAFIGDYDKEQPLDCQINNLLDFLKNAVSASLLNPDFKVVGAWQVYKYAEKKNPGKHLMERIKEWDMWTNKIPVRPP